MSQLDEDADRQGLPTQVRARRHRGADRQHATDLRPHHVGRGGTTSSRATSHGPSRSRAPRPPRRASVPRGQDRGRFLAYADAQTIADIVLELFGQANSASRNCARDGDHQSRPTDAAAEHRTLPVGTKSSSGQRAAEQLRHRAGGPDPRRRRLIDTAWDIPSREGNIFLYDSSTPAGEGQSLLATLLETGGGGNRPAGRTVERPPERCRRRDADIARIEVSRFEPSRGPLQDPGQLQLARRHDRADRQPSASGSGQRRTQVRQAIDVADILNTLSPEPAAAADIGEGLSGIDFESAAPARTDRGQQTRSGLPTRSDEATDEAAEVSALVGKSRVVPNPAELLRPRDPRDEDALLGIIEDLDRPAGRS